MAGWNSKSKKRKVAIKSGYKSNFELEIATYLESKKIDPVKSYEVKKISYTIPESTHKYTVDWQLPNGILIETKGRWTPSDRKKMVLVKAQHPELDIRMVFVNGNNKISKGSKTTYGSFCDKHNILWTSKTIPEHWIKELPISEPTPVTPDISKSWFD